jgi:hypothetical protein
MRLRASSRASASADLGVATEALLADGAEDGADVAPEEELAFAQA